VKIRAPAKINLSLRVIGQREDGYHLIDTIMAPVSLYDEVEVRKLSGSGKRMHSKGLCIELTCDDPSVPAGEKNLAYRAAYLFLQKYGRDEHIRIRLRKRIPVGAGLGGGSSDAAATLIGLNRLFKLNLSNKKLRNLALRLGSDVPFFISPGPKRARGIGERLTPLKPFPRFWLVILYPGLVVSTAWAYGNYRTTLTKPSANISIRSSLRSSRKIAALMTNDLETVTLRRYPIIGLLKKELARAGAAGVLMAGSGSSVFGVFDTQRKARNAFRRLRKKGGPQAFLAHILG
jgi:4-diphosphocytidyl-2-C-methyl-D-erythritol kinase